MLLPTLKPACSARLRPAALVALAALAACAPAHRRALAAGDRALHDGRYERALALYEKSAAEAAAAGAPAEERARALGAEGAALMVLGRPSQAEAAYKGALQELKAGPPLARAAMLSALGYACALQGRAADAAASYRRALEEYGKAPDAPAREVAARWADLGQLSLAERRYPEAEQAYARAAALREKAGGPQAALAPLLEDLAAALEGQGKKAEADAARKRAGALRGEP
jgi:tetratricopeptide (TPR) repeat protein